MQLEDGEVSGSVASSGPSQGVKLKSQRGLWFSMAVLGGSFGALMLVFGVAVMIGGSASPGRIAVGVLLVALGVGGLVFGRLALRLGQSRPQLLLTPESLLVVHPGLLRQPLEIKRSDVEAVCLGNFVGYRQPPDLAGASLWQRVRSYSRWLDSGSTGLTVRASSSLLDLSSVMGGRSPDVLVVLRRPYDLSSIPRRGLGILAPETAPFHGPVRGARIRGVLGRAANLDDARQTFTLCEWSSTIPPRRSSLGSPLPAAAPDDGARRTPPLLCPQRPPGRMTAAASPIQLHTSQRWMWALPMVGFGIATPLLLVFGVGATYADGFSAMGRVVIAPLATGFGVLTLFGTRLCFRLTRARPRLFVEADSFTLEHPGLLRRPLVVQRADVAEVCIREFPSHGGHPARRRCPQQAPVDEDAIVASSEILPDFSNPLVSLTHHPNVLVVMRGDLRLGSTPPRGISTVVHLTRTGDHDGPPPGRRRQRRPVPGGGPAGGVVGVQALGGSWSTNPLMAPRSGSPRRSSGNG